MTATYKNMLTYTLIPLCFLLFWSSLDFSIVSTDPASDYQNYFTGYELASVETLRGFTSIAGWEPGFEILLWLFAATGVSFQFFMIAQSVFILLAFYTLSLKTFDNTAMAVLAVAILFATPMFQSFSLVIVRQSLAMGFFFIFLSALIEGKKLKATLLACLAISMHSSATIFVFSSIVSILARRRDNAITFAFIIVFILYALNVSGDLLSGFTSYVYQLVFNREDLLVSDAYVTGTKTTFLVAVLLAYAPSIYLKIYDKENLKLKLLRQTAMILGIAFMAAADLPYYDRIAIAPFCLAPIFLVAFLRAIGSSMAAIASR